MSLPALFKRFPKGMLSRDFISESLYGHGTGYFATREVILTPKQIDFGNLLGKREYKQTLSQLYKELPDAWTTPVELFAPWYSYALAKYMLHSRVTNDELRVIEVGAGNGTNALHILNYVKVSTPSLSVLVLDAIPSVENQSGGV